MSKLKQGHSVVNCDRSGALGCTKIYLSLNHVCSGVTDKLFIFFQLSTRQEDLAVLKRKAARIGSDLLLALVLFVCRLGIVLFCIALL